MNIPIEVLEEYRNRYPAGTKIKITSAIEDPFTPKQVGDIFTVSYIDDAGNIHGRWKSGGSMAILLEVDSFEVYTEETD